MSPLLTLITTFVAATLISAGDGKLPEGRAGLAATHPGDAGLETEDAVLFREAFEAADLDEILARWEDVRTKEVLSLDADVPAQSRGKASLRMDHVGGQSDGAHLYRRLEPGLDKVHLRFYVKFDPACQPVHHFVHLGGYAPSTAWPLGGAGVRPRGEARFTTGIEPGGPRWTWDHYAYWTEMRGSPPRGQTWGNRFVRDPRAEVKKGAWTCIEVMLRVNDVGDTDGELALWIDGVLISHLGKGFPRGKWVYDDFRPGEGGEGVRWHDSENGPERFDVPAGGAPFEGFRWRTAEELNVNFLWLLFYVTKAPEGHVSTVWFDDLVVAREYIGPLEPDSQDGVRRLK